MTQILGLKLALIFLVVLVIMWIILYWNTYRNSQLEINNKNKKIQKPMDENVEFLRAKVR